MSSLSRGKGGHFGGKRDCEVNPAEVVPKEFPRCPGKNLSYWVSLARGDQQEDSFAEVQND
ncbi:MAG TPA: hypothetical protein VK553_04920 [Candidatus Nitrosopolaris rasttigaisensis]|nr:hypothetical protein [Candidatus Nitrosopolaris rasttigaisensis]